MAQQQGNANTAPELENTNPNQSPVDAIFDNGGNQDFFEELDKSVNGGILDETSQLTSNSLSDNTLTSPSEEQEQSETNPNVVDVETMQKRYSDSSREAKRLNGQLKEIEPYMPILDAMRDDPNLITHVRNYFEGGGQTPENMAQKLNLPEDFSFDAEEAFATPESNSAKVLGATIDGIVQNRLNKALQGQRTENQRLAKEASFRQKHKLNDDEWAEFVDFAKSKSLELDDIYYLMNRKNRDNKIASSTRDEMREKMRQTQEIPNSLATQGSTQVEQSPDDKIFDALLGSESEIEKAFSI
jgi:hypothetical protein